MSRLGFRSAACALALTTLTACGGPEVVDAGGVTVLVGERADSAMDALLPGTLAEVAGCLGVTGETDSYVVIWPYGTEVVDEDPLTISIPTEGEFSIGDELQVGGGGFNGLELGDTVLADACPGVQVWLAN